MEAEEEDYFNAEDDEEPPATSTPPRWQTNVVIGAIKRKRQRGGAANALRHARPATPTPPLTPPLGSLVDYEDDDEQSNGDSSPFRPTVNSSPHRNLQPIGSPQPPSSPTDASASPRLSHRQNTPSKLALAARSSSDDEDDLLEALANRSPSPQMVAEKLMTPLIGSLPISGKRRRDEVEEDGLLDRLSRPKRPSFQRSNSSDVPSARSASPKHGDDQPKKFKVKLGSVGKALTSGSSPTPSDSQDPGPKDGDGG
jgi:protein phosphatase 4 regulatory subunit 3